MSIPYDLDSLVFLAQGSEGVIYTTPTQKDVVIKIMDKDFTRNSFSKIRKICFYLQESSFKEIVTIFDYGTFQKNKQKYFWILMEKLKPLSKNERKEFKILKDIYHNYFLSKNSKSEEEWIEIIGVWKKKLKNKKTKNFLDKIIKLPVYHVDLFEDNILKDQQGNYKIIDINDLKMVK
jgi:serine/threonine protein kinase